MLIGIAAVCTILLNIIWFAALCNWPTIRLEYTIMEYTIMFTILLSTVAAVLSGWSLLP